MAKVIVKFYATIREKIKTDYIELEADTFKKAIEILIKMHPLLKKELVDDDFSMKDDYIYLVNGRNIVFLQGENTPLKEGDRLAIFPPVGGG
ncbi:MAG: MoaD/ThiS family protein [Caldisericaceae bacterium]|nr:MoaD/ThiS family protein [Caldisericaceae bacterium]RLD18794.1 MAG: molybdopterin synthase sulfur carrier subunit [Caldisericota bacterium]